jgi:Mrp family chromosome partitioning ATPase
MSPTRVSMRPPGRSFDACSIATKPTNRAAWCARWCSSQATPSRAARSGEGVLFIEAQNAARKSAAPAGLAEVLRGERTLWQVIRVTPGSDMKRMEIGRSKTRLPKTAGTAFVRRMLGDAQRQFDLLIVNAGALDDHANLAGLVAAADDIVLVAKLAATRQSDLASLNETARIMGRPISAIVLADATMQA